MEFGKNFFFRLIIFTAALQLIFPSTTNPFRVRSISPKLGLLVRISKTSPPVAALEDAQLQFAPEEFPQPKTLEPEKVRLLPGLRLTKKEIEPAVEKPKIVIADSGKSAEVLVSAADFRKEPTESEPRRPRIINFREIMDRVRGGRLTVLLPAADISDKNKLADNSNDSSPSTYTYINPTTPNNEPDTAYDSNPYTDMAYDVSGSVEETEMYTQGVSKIVITHQLNGRVLSRVEPEKDSSFRFRSKYSTGLVVGELRNQKGEVIARAEKSLDKLPKRGQKISNLILKLESVPSYSSNGHGYSASGGGSVHSPVADVSFSSMGLRASDSDEMGKFEFRGVLPESSMIVKSQKKGFFGTVMISNAKQSLPIMMYPQKMVAGLIAISGAPVGFDHKDLNRYGIVWGRVNTREGEAMVGAKVEITDNQSIGPIYFNDFFLPDSKLESTSSNGMFVFLRVQKGSTIVRANQNGRMMPLRVVPVEPNFISHVELESTEKEKASIQTFDAFTKASVPSEIRFLGAPRSARTNADGILKTAYAKTADPFILEIDPTGDYVPVKFHAPRAGEEFFVPQISNDWLNSLRLNQGPDFGTIIGFVAGQRFDVFMDVDGKPHQEIYYFNASGDIVPVPVAGGGFVIANVPAGLRTVSLVPEGSPAIYSQVLSVDGSFVSIMTKSF